MGLPVQGRIGEGTYGCWEVVDISAEGIQVQGLSPDLARACGNGHTRPVEFEIRVAANLVWSEPGDGRTGWRFVLVPKN